MLGQILYILCIMVIFPIGWLLWLQGRHVRGTIPHFPEASGERQGQVGKGLPFNLLVMGESTVAGVGVQTMEETVTASIARSLSQMMGQTVNWSAKGINGLTAHSLREEFAEKVARERVDVIVICLGANDAFNVHSPLRWKRDCLRLVHALRKTHSCPIIFADIPPIRWFPAFPRLLRLTLGYLAFLYRKPLREIAKHEKNVFYIDRPFRFDISPGRRLEDYFSDGVHPSKMCYDQWAKSLAKFILKCIHS